MRLPTIVFLSIGLVACAPHKAPVRSVADLLEDPVELQSVIDRCAAMPAKAATDPECANARIAIDRKGSQKDSAQAATAQQEFERRRAQLREQEDRKRAAQEPAKAGFDPYTSPVTVDPAPTPPKP